MYLLNLRTLEVHDTERENPLCNLAKIKAKRAFTHLSEAQDYVRETRWPKLGEAGLCWWCIGAHAKE